MSLIAPRCAVAERDRLHRYKYPHVRPHQPLLVNEQRLNMRVNLASAFFCSRKAPSGDETHIIPL